MSAGAVISGVLLGTIGGWYLADAAKDRNTHALIVGLVFVGMSWVVFLRGAG